MPVIGSLGDVISLCVVVNNLRKVIIQSRDSSAEYHAIVTELATLEHVLVQAGMLWGDGESSDEIVDEFRVLIRTRAELCREFIKDFHAKIKKFGPSLHRGSSEGVVRDTARKLQWQLSRSDEVIKFRAGIIAHYSAINVLVATTTM